MSGVEEEGAVFCQARWEAGSWAITWATVFPLRDGVRPCATKSPHSPTRGEVGAAPPSPVPSSEANSTHTGPTNKWPQFDYVKDDNCEWREPQTVETVVSQMGVQFRLSVQRLVNELVVHPPALVELMDSGKTAAVRLSADELSQP